MLYDRKITITTGNNRKSINWQPLTITLSEFYDKLRVPSRSTETMAEYLALKKSEQDDRKDIGGFVAGSLNGPRRKAGAVTGRPRRPGAGRSRGARAARPPSRRR